MSEFSTLTIRIDPDIKERLDRIAKHDRRAKSFLASEALEAYVKSREWWESKIEMARASEAATEEEVDTFFERWKV